MKIRNLCYASSIAFLCLFSTNINAQSNDDLSAYQREILTIESVTEANDYLLQISSSEKNNRLQVAQGLYEGITSQPKVAAAAQEIQKNPNYIPQHYLSINDSKFIQPDYTGDLESDKAKCYNAILIWVINDYTLASNYLTKKF